MKRVMLDTNIYGKIVENRDEMVVRKAFEQLKKPLIVYGFKVVRAELRETSKEVKLYEIKLRTALLSIYDFVVKNHELAITSKINGTAEDYYLTYRKIGGIKSKDEILNDFKIIACAAINNLDIVYSEDNKTMLSDAALTTYSIVNGIKKIRTPKFVNYEEFIKEIKRWLI